MVNMLDILKPAAKNILGRILSNFVTEDMANEAIIPAEISVLDAKDQVIEIHHARNILERFFSKYQGFSDEEIDQELSGLTCDEDGMWTTNKILWTTGLYLMTFDSVCRDNIFENTDDFNDVVIIIDKIYNKFTPICILQPA